MNPKKSRKKRSARYHKTSKKKYVLKGGVKWRAGADTCIFMPQVACKDFTTPLQYTGTDYISRIVPKGSEDVQTELFIRKHFPDLLKRGIVNVQVHTCTPDFQRTNLNYTKNYNSKRLRQTCGPINMQNEDNYINMISKFFNGGDVYSVLQENEYTDEEIFKGLQGALNAAVGLVPDNGPWVIHADCHLQNILNDATTPITALADWGRVIIITDPSNPRAVLKGFDNYLQSVWGGQTFKQLSQRTNLDSYPQHPTFIFEELQAYYDGLLDFIQKNPSVTQDEEIAKQMTVLRGWTTFAIFNSIFQRVNYDTDDLSRILQCTSQMELQELINTSIGDKLGMKDYINTAKPSTYSTNVAPTINISSQSLEKSIKPEGKRLPPPMVYTEGAVLAKPAPKPLVFNSRRKLAQPAQPQYGINPNLSNSI